MSGFVFAIIGFVIGAVVFPLIVGLVASIAYRQKMEPVSRRHDHLIAWLDRPLRDPEIPRLYSEQWTRWIKRLVRDWKDEERAVMAVRSYLGSKAEDCVDRLERDLERAAVEYRGSTLGIYWLRDPDVARAHEKRIAAEIESIFHRPMERTL